MEIEQITLNDLVDSIKTYLTPKQLVELNKLASQHLKKNQILELPEVSRIELVGENIYRISENGSFLNTYEILTRQELINKVIEETEPSILVDVLSDAFVDDSVVMGYYKFNKWYRKEIRSVS